MQKTAQNLSEISDQVMSSTVSIETNMIDGKKEMGAGFYVAERVLITCAHVIGVTPQNLKPEIKSIFIIHSNGKKYNAYAVYADPNLDIAVLNVNIQEKEDMYFLNLGNSGTINIGEAVITIGNPLGFRDTLSYGIIKNTMEKDKRFFLVGMDTNPGNSGGLIYSLRKQAVIGVISAVINSSNQQSAGISVGIAIDPIKDILKKVGVRFVYRENNDEI